MHREVLCHSEALPPCGDHLLATRWTLLHPHRSYSLMRESKILCMPCSYTCACSLCRLPLAPAGRWTFPALLCDSFPGCLDPYSGGICAAYDRFFAQITGLPRALTSRLEKISHYHKMVSSTTSEERVFSELQSFRYVQASRFARRSGCSHHRTKSHSNFGFYFRAEPTLLPS